MELVPPLCDSTAAVVPKHILYSLPMSMGSHDKTSQLDNYCTMSLYVHPSERHKYCVAKIKNSKNEVHKTSLKFLYFTSPLGIQYILLSLKQYDIQSVYMHTLCCG